MYWCAAAVAGIFTNLCIGLHICFPWCMPTDTIYYGWSLNSTCLPFLKTFVLPRAKRADRNSVNNAKKEEKKPDSLDG
jgi:hypothetical protein